jgi:hypothetical protein
LLEVLRRQQVADAHEKIERLLLESLAEESTPMTDKDWDRIRAAI